VMYTEHYSVPANNPLLCSNIPLLCKFSNSEGEVSSKGAELDEAASISEIVCFVGV